LFSLTVEVKQDMSGSSRILTLRYVIALAPGVVLLLIAILISVNQKKANRTQRVADHARLAAVSVDRQLQELLDLTVFCVTAPALTERIDLADVAENCGRYARQIGAWIVLTETGETHRQLLNTLPYAPAVLPSYPREDEQAALLELEQRSRISGMPAVADVFTGRIYQRAVVGTGQHLRLADGLSALLYVTVPAETLSNQLASISADGGPIFALIDPSQRLVARSVGIERVMFAEAPEWLLPHMRSTAAGVSLGVPGPSEIGGTWDAGYHPLNTAPGSMATAVLPTPVGAQFWAFASLPSAITLLGILLSGLLFWTMADRDRAARRVTAATLAEAEAERRNSEKSRLLVSFAHDIRSPLISLIGSLEMIEEGRSAVNGQIRTARGSAEALLQLVDDILELSFLGSGELTLHPSPVDLRQLAEALSDQTRPLAVRKRLDLRLDLDSNLPVTVEVDRLRLQQVLSNLLTNAVKYTEKGSVTLRVREEGAHSGHVTLALSVIDTGIGLAPEEIPQIMREFGRLEREVERREQGTGLGLAIVQRILSRMGATLEVESAPGQGSTFSFHLTLPVATSEEVTDATRPLGGVIILYAEDEPVIRQVTARRLEEAGAKVIRAVDGEDALRQLGAVTPDLLLIDLQMPGLDGTGLIHRLGEVAPERPYPTFVLTSHISGPQAAEARAAGADAVFTKPVQVAALAAAFRARHGNGGCSTPLGRETAEGANEPLLDPRTFGEFVEVMGASEACTIVGEFEETMRGELSALEALTGRADLKQAGELAHRCQGLCLVMGAVALARLFREMELAAENGNMTALLGFASSTAPCFEATAREMRSTLQCSEPERSQ